MAFFDLEQAILAYPSIDDFIVVDRPDANGHPDTAAYPVSRKWPLMKSKRYWLFLTAGIEGKPIMNAKYGTGPG